MDRVVTWGDAQRGGDSSAVAALLEAAVGRADALRGLAERAAAALGVAHCRLIGPEGWELRPGATLEGAGLPDPVTLTAVASRRPVVCASRWGGAFAAITWQGRVVAWGRD